MINGSLLRAPYLRVQRQFPNDDLKALANQMDQAYIDIASKVNNRILGNYPVDFLAVTGERWFFKGSSQSQQSLRQVYPFTAAGNIPHKLKWNAVSSISPRSYGTYLDTSGNWNGVIYGSSTAIAAQLSFFVNDTNIVVLDGGIPIPLANGFIILEYISEF
jgi:hypothetical protein